MNFIYFVFHNSDLFVLFGLDRTFCPILREKRPEVAEDLVIARREVRSDTKGAATEINRHCAGEQRANLKAPAAQKRCTRLEDADNYFLSPEERGQGKGEELFELTHTPPPF